MELLQKVDIYCRNHVTNVSEYIGRKALQAGEKCDKYLDTISDKRKYVCEVLLLVPLIFIIHQWALLSPYSSYWFIDIFLFLLRYGMALIMTGVWAFNSGVRFQMMTYTLLDMFVAWIRLISYWSYQEEAYGVCHETNVLVWSDVTDSWWIPALVSFMIQFCYFAYRPGTILSRDACDFPLIYLAPLISLLPDVFSMIGLYTASMSEVSYWIQSALFCLICFSEVVSSFDMDSKVDESKKQLLYLALITTENEQTKQIHRNRILGLQQRIDKRKEGGNYIDRIPGRWFLRDVMITFIIPYIFLVFSFDIVIYQKGFTSLLSLETIIESLATWCTTYIIVMGITDVLGILSNMGVALSYLFLTREVNIVEAFNANIGGIVTLSALISFLEANILSLEYTEKVEAMKVVVLLSAYSIVFQVLDVLKQKVFHAVNSGASPGILFYLRVGILTGLLVTVPTLSTFIVSKHLDISPWLLFFASGNCTLIMRTVCMLTECTLITLTWHTTRYSSTLEDIIYYFHVSESVGIALLHAVHCYFRYTCQFFKAWWFFRFCIALLSFIVVTVAVGFVEFNRYQSRIKMTTLLKNLPTVTFSVTSGDHEEENEHECAICYSVMSRGKTLPCAHTFHEDCIRRWFQVKTVCPFCNTNIVVDSPGARTDVAT